MPRRPEAEAMSGEVGDARKRLAEQAVEPEPTTEADESNIIRGQE